MRTRPRRFGAACAVVTAALAHPAWIHASEAAHGEAPAPSIGELVYPVINFALFAFVIGKYVVPAMREYLRRRSEDIVGAVRESAAALAAAGQTLAAAKRRHATLASERESVRRDLVAAATRLAERLRADAVESGKRRIADAGLVADQERRRALDAVRAEIAALATEIAESRIRAALSADDQLAFVRQFLKDAPSR